MCVFFYYRRAGRIQPHSKNKNIEVNVKSSVITVNNEKEKKTNLKNVKTIFVSFDSQHFSHTHTTPYI